MRINPRKKRKPVKTAIKAAKRAIAFEKKNRRTIRAAGRGILPVFPVEVREAPTLIIIYHGRPEM